MHPRASSEWVCCLDLGTTHLKAALVDRRGRLAALARAPVPDPAAEFDASRLLLSACALVRRLLRAAPGRAPRVAALCVTNQRATLVAYPRRPGGRAPAFSWKDPRGADAFARFAARVGPARFRALTGLPPSALWSVGRLEWLRSARPELRRAAPRFGLLHDHALAGLGADGAFVDPSNASVTGLLDVRRMEWCPALLKAAGLPATRLPSLRPAGSPAGALSRAAAARTGLPAGTPLVVGGGDQQCAALGMGVIDPGQAGLCVGTVAVFSFPCSAPRAGAQGFFLTAHALPDRWLLEGIHPSFGSCFQQPLALLGLNRPREVARLMARAGEGAHGAGFLPFLAGTGSPDFRAGARAAWFGLDAAHRREDLALCALEAAFLELRRVFEAAARLCPARRLTLSGGGARHPHLRQAVADVTGCRVASLADAEATLRGASVLAWTGAGRFASVAEAARALAPRAAAETRPGPRRARWERLYERHLQAVRALAPLDEVPA
jgi:sugar (pentulose or hexulose) kinase